MHFKSSVFIAMSLDGFIARDDGSIDWLMEANKLAPKDEDCGYKSFISTVDIMIMGRHSFEKVLSFDEWPYGELPVIVLSSNNIEIPQHLKSSVTVSNKKPYDLYWELEEKTIELQQAVLDGDIPVIERILDVQPELLLQEPKRVNVIQSELTWKKVFGEMPFSMALKTRQNKVINAMLPYIGSIDNGQQIALALWNAIDELPVKAPYRFKSLIDVIATETFPNGFEGKLSDASAQALKAFKDSVNPQEAIALQDDYDVLWHLVLAFKAYAKHFSLFNN